MFNGAGVDAQRRGMIAFLLTTDRAALKRLAQATPGIPASPALYPGQS